MMTKDNDLIKDDDQVSDWTKGLPSSEELTPLSHTLVSRILASAFRIKHEEPMTAEDVQRESQATMRSLFNQKSAPSFDAFAAFQEEEEADGYGYGRGVEEEFRGKRRAVNEDEFRANQDTEADASRSNREDHRSTSSRPEIPRLPSSGSATEKSPQNLQPKHNTTKTTATEAGAGIDTNSLEDRTDGPGQSTSPFMKNAQSYAPYENQVEGGKEDENVEPEDANSAGGPAEEDPNAKRTRLVWTPQLHKRFVEAVGHLGIKNAVPKTIMQLMNVEGLTRENVASHLQKYRLYLKRMQGLSSDEPSPSDHLFASTPLPHEGAPFQTPMGFVRPGQFGGFEHVPFGGGFVHQAPVMMNEGRSRSVHHRGLHVQANSSSQCELPLFPTNGNRR